MPAPDASRLKEKVRRLPHGPGVYLMKDRLGQIIYVGKAKDLKKRVSTYFQPSRRTRAEQPKVAAMLEMVWDFETVEVKSEPEALLLEGSLIKQWKPKYNTDFVDDKRFLLVRVDLESPLPRFGLVRFKKGDRSAYFGPFAHSGLLRRTLAEMRKRYGILLGDARPRPLEAGGWRLYEDARAEIYGHPNEVSEQAYAARVEAACVFLEGKSRQWLAELKVEMEKAAADRAYERAAELRDVVFALEKTVLKTRKFSRPGAALAPPGDAEIVARLGETLGLPAPPRHVECFDISHISGTFCVASMVHFKDGVPDKSNYRRFKVRGELLNDDFLALEEVVGRRYRRLHEEGREGPDLVVIDGGRGQVTAALRAFLSHELEPPPLVGLAKRRETVFFTDGRPPLNLPLNDPALQLLQRLRDEAHRFANTFNAELRSRKIRETILDDFAGLGPVRRKALLDHFGTLERLRGAGVEQLLQVEGIGPKTAAALRAFLDRAGA